MPPADVTWQDRQRAVQQMQSQLMRLGQPGDKAGGMATKVEDAAFNRATNKHEYLQFLQTSLKKAQAALQRQAAAQHQQQAAPQIGNAMAMQQQAAMQQQQQRAAQQAAAPQQYGGAPQQYGAPAQTPAHQQFAQMQPQQAQYMHQQQAPAQQQYVQQAAPVQQQYMQAVPQQQQQQQYHLRPQAAMQQQAPQQQHYMQAQQAQQAAYPGQQQQYLQQQQQQPMYMQQQPQAQPQYMQQQAPAQQPMYMQQQPPQPQYMQQSPAQPQYMQQAPQQQTQYMQQAVPQQQQHPGQPQYMQAQQQQPAQQQHAHYMQQQAQARAMPSPEHARLQAQQASVPGMNQQVLDEQRRIAAMMAGSARPAPARAPPQQAAQQAPAQQQQYMQPSGTGASGYTGQQFSPAPPQAGMQHQHQHMARGAAPTGTAGAGMQPRQLGPGPDAFARLPSFDDPAFGDFAAEFFPDSGQPAKPLAPPAASQQSRYAPQMPPPPQHPSPSVAESSGPGPATAAAAQAGREATSGAGARRQFNHEPAALKEFLRLHAAFTAPGTKQMATKDAEHMLRFYRDTAKQSPQHTERVAAKLKRHTMILQLLLTEAPHQQISINEQVLATTRVFLKDLAQFRDIMKKSAQKQAAKVGESSVASPAAAGSPAGTGFMAMLESADSDALKRTASLPSGGAAAAGKPPPAAASPAAAAQQSAASAAAEAARQQAQARQRQLAEAAAEQKRRQEAAAAALAALPPGGTKRLLSVAQQATAPQDAEAAQGGYRKLQKAIAAMAQRQLPPSQGQAGQVQAVSTPPLPAEVQRLVARERAALEQAAGDAAAAGKGGTALLTTAGGEGRVPEAQQQFGSEGSPGPEGPAAKRQRSLSPEVATSAPAGSPGGTPAGQQRQKSELELRLAAECEEAAGALSGGGVFHVGPDGADPSCAVVTCMPKAGPGQADQQWAVLRLRVSPSYPEEAPTAVFPQAGQGGASEAQAAAAARRRLLTDACRKRFQAALVAATAGGAQPRLQQIAAAWLDATQQVSALAEGGA